MSVQPSVQLAEVTNKDGRVNSSVKDVDNKVQTIVGSLSINQLQGSLRSLSGKLGCGS